MISALYVVLGALLVMKFTMDVVRYRRFYRVAYGDGGYHDLKMAIRIHGNAIETIPLALLLLPDLFTCIRQGLRSGLAGYKSSNHKRETERN